MNGHSGIGKRCMERRQDELAVGRLDVRSGLGNAHVVPYREAPRTPGTLIKPLSHASQNQTSIEGVAPVCGASKTSAPPMRWTWLLRQSGHRASVVCFMGCRYH